jgi:ElaB/YqjD/DUF883 family membrane-anchored ribosome-binding protein
MKKIVLMASLLMVVCQDAQGMKRDRFGVRADDEGFDGGSQQNCSDTVANAQMIERGFSAPQASNDSWQAPKKWPIEASVYGVGMENLHKSDISMMFMPKDQKLFKNQLMITKKLGVVYSPVQFHNFKFPLGFQVSESKNSQVKYLEVTSVINTLPETVQYFCGFQQKAMLGINYLNNFLHYCGNKNYGAARGMLALLQGKKAVDFGSAVRYMLDEDAIKNVIEVEITFVDNLKGSLANLMAFASAAADEAKQQLQQGAADLSSAAVDRAGKMTKEAQYKAANFAGKCNIMVKKYVGPWRGMAIGATVMFLICMRFMRK